jgi:hypothetical protein
VNSRRVTSATSVRLAMKIFRNHFFGMGGTKPLRSDGPAEGRCGGAAAADTNAGMRRMRRFNVKGMAFVSPGRRG